MTDDFASQIEGVPALSTSDFTQVLLDFLAQVLIFTHETNRGTLSSDGVF